MFHVRRAVDADNTITGEEPAPIDPDHIYYKKHVSKAARISLFSSSEVRPYLKGLQTPGEMRLQARLDPAATLISQAVIPHKFRAAQPQKGEKINS